MVVSFPTKIVMVVVFSPDGRGVSCNINNDGNGVFPITRVLVEARFSSKNGDGENTPQRTKHLCHLSVTVFFCHRRNFGIHIMSFSGQVSALCFAHKHSGILLKHCHRLAHFDDNSRKGKSMCVHTTFTHCEPQTL